MEVIEKVTKDIEEMISLAKAKKARLRESIVGCFDHEYNPDLFVQMVVDRWKECDFEITAYQNILRIIDTRLEENVVDEDEGK